MVLPRDDSGRDASPPHQQRRRPISTSPAWSCHRGTRRRRPLARSTTAAAPTRLRSPSPWCRRLRLWHFTMRTAPSPRPRQQWRALLVLPKLAIVRTMECMGESTSNP